MRNVEVAWIFRELADLLELKGEDFFKIRAYRNAARILNGLDKPLVEIWQEGGLAKIPGIGKNIAAKINELLSTGSMKKHEELLQEFPPGLLEIMSLPGIGPKKAALLRERLGVTGLGELARAARENRVRTLPGMGSKTESEIIRNIEMRENQGGRVLLASARELASEICGYLKGIPGVKRVETGGSLRRWRETVGDIDLVAAGDDPPLILEGAACYPRFRQMLESSPGRAKFLTDWGIVVDLEVVPEEVFYLTLFKNTGSKAHYRRLQQLFTERGLALEEAGITGGGAIIREQDIYAALGLPWIPPELREDRGEVEAALGNCLPSLLETDDLKGDLHIHTNWSNGLAGKSSGVPGPDSQGLAQTAFNCKDKGYFLLPPGRFKTGPGLFHQVGVMSLENPVPGKNPSWHLQLHSRTSRGALHRPAAQQDPAHLPGGPASPGNPDFDPVPCAQGFFQGYFHQAAGAVKTLDAPQADTAVVRSLIAHQLPARPSVKITGCKIPVKNLRQIPGLFGPDSIGAPCRGPVQKRPVDPHHRGHILRPLHPAFDFKGRNTGLN